MNETERGDFHFREPPAERANFAENGLKLLPLWEHSLREICGVAKGETDEISLFFLSAKHRHCTIHKWDEPISEKEPQKVGP